MLLTNGSDDRGHRPPARSATGLTLPQITALYIGSVLGSGILIIPGIAAEIAGPASLLAWAGMAVLVIPMALTMGLLSARFPNSGGVSHFVSTAFGHIPGSLVGWFFASSVVVGAPVLALTGSGYLCAAMGWGDRSRLAIAAAMLAVGLAVNHIGVKLTARIQFVVVLSTLAILAFAIAGNLSAVQPSNLKPFMPAGWASVGTCTAVLFWCFLGWEAASNFSSEFGNPRRDAVTGTVVAAVAIGIVYFLTGFVVVGTRSYGSKISDAALVHVIRHSSGPVGGIVAGFVAMFICMAPLVSYVGAVARLVASLSDTGHAPRILSARSAKHGTPLGGLVFLGVSFSLLLLVFSSRIADMGTLLRIPSATFILTYLGGCAAGVKLLRNDRLGLAFSVVSLGFSAIVLLFVGWSILYALIVTILWATSMQLSGRFASKA
jgi:amino acid efflux transporter